MAKATLLDKKVPLVQMIAAGDGNQKFSLLQQYGRMQFDEAFTFLMGMTP